MLSRSVEYEHCVCFAGPVNLVLNSLTSPGMVAATLVTLALGAKFAEIGKREIWSPQRVAQERPDVAYQLVAIDFLPLPVLRSSFQRLSAMMGSQAIAAVPATKYSFDSVAAALRKLSQVWDTPCCAFKVLCVCCVAKDVAVCFQVVLGCLPLPKNASAYANNQTYIVLK